MELGTAPITLVVGATASARAETARAAVERWLERHPTGVIVEAPAAATWPFLHPLTVSLPSPPAIVWMPDVHAAAINHQTAGTRLVTTQLTYLFEVWRATVAGRDDVLMVATADGEHLKQHAPEALTGRGPFRDGVLHRLEARAGSRPTSARPEPDELRRGLADAAGFGREGGESAVGSLESVERPLRIQDSRLPTPDSRMSMLARAMRADDPAERLALCVQALEHGRTPAALVATASACMEVNNLEAAARDLDEALAQAPEWAAAWFERGKLWLRVDDMEQASHAFREAAERLPAFVSAWANLGATCGELDRPKEALAAFEHALAYDPGNHQVLNNIGVVRRELGRLPESEAAFRQVIGLTPDLAFGYYNLGHTLFLQGRYQAALAAYTDGQRRDAERNPVQAMRLALCRLAIGDAAGALRDLEQTSAGLPREYRRQLLADANAIAWALLTHKPDLPGWKHVNDWLDGELRKLA